MNVRSIHRLPEGKLATLPGGIGGVAPGVLAEPPIVAASRKAERLLNHISVFVHDVAGAGAAHVNGQPGLVVASIPVNDHIEL